MDKPYKYHVFCEKERKFISSSNYPPSLDKLRTWEETDDPKIRVEKITKTIYEDSRYDAKLRLWNYINYTKKGIELPKYRPFAGTQIGITLPILNF